MQLNDLGELRILEEIILPLARSFDQSTEVGDDCAFIEAGGATLAITTDVGPKPLIMQLPGYAKDWEAAGWMAVVATASDVATAGATPLFLSNCIDAPPDLSVDVLRSFMTGYFKAMSSFGFANGGGDLRQGQSFEARVFGVGKVDHAARLGRSVAREGDRVFLVGAAGYYLSSFLLARWHYRHKNVAEGRKIVEGIRFPLTQIDPMRHLTSKGFVSAASDTSDGLIGAIDNLARSSGFSFELTLEDNQLSEQIEQVLSLEIIENPWNLFFSWGDWSVAVIVPQEKHDDFKEECRAKNYSVLDLGIVKGREGKIFVSLNGSNPREAAIIRNENFLKEGFNAGIDEHLDYMLKSKLFKE